MSYTFTWGSGPSEVIVTGTFDNWSKSFPLIKTPSGSFELTVPLPKTDDKILYKYVVDGEWVISPNAVIENDNGISNNVLYPSDLVSVAGADTVVPESGLPISNNNKTNNGEEKELKTTVLPSSENQQQTMGEPGIAIPANAASIDAFNTVSTVDPKSLNVDEQEEKEVPVAAPISTSNPKNSKKKKKVKKSKKKVKKNGATTSKDASPGPESVTTSTTNENADVTETSEAASDAPEVVAAEETKVAPPTATTAVEEKEVTAPTAVEKKEVKEEVAAPVVVEEAKEEHKTLDPASSVKTTEPEPESEIVGVEEVAPEDVAKLAEDEQIVAVEEVDDPETETSPVVKDEEPVVKEEEPIVKDEEPVAKKEEPKKTTPATTPAKKTTPTPAKKATPAKEEKKKGFFSKLKKLLS